MKIAAFSDSHGCLNLPNIDKDTDVVCIAGDIVPLDYQRNMINSYLWFKEVFITWVKDLEVKKVFLVAGNHDFWMESHLDELKELIKSSGLEDKLIYLFDDEYTFENKKFYGSPWIKDLSRWAFYSPDLNEQFKHIPDCDVLITHIPPKVDKVGCSDPYTIYERDFGSEVLSDVLKNKDIKINICGHIHTGEHNGVEYENTTIYNVSLLNEYYREIYEVTYFEI